MWSNYPEIEKELILVEEFIKKNVKSRNRLLMGAVYDLIQSGGKRLRPAFVILASKFGRYNRKKVIPAAGAVEILHTATLVHDDIIDKTKIRRGNKTVSEKLGTDMAVYVGDYLYTKAVLMLSENVPANKLGMVAKGIKAICEGEVDQYQYKYDIDTSAYTYLKRISRKTGVLFSSACVLGADISKCSRRVSRNLSKFGLYYGIAFQIKDDIDNLVQSVHEAGKPVGNDILEGIVTLPVIMALKMTPDLKKIVSEFMSKKGEVSSEKLIHVIELIKKSGGIDVSREILNKYIDKGLSALDNLPDNIYKGIFSSIINGLK